MKLFPLVLSCGSYLDNFLINEKQVLYEALKKLNLFPHRISCNKYITNHGVRYLTLSRLAKILEIEGPFEFCFITSLLHTQIYVKHTFLKSP